MGAARIRSAPAKADGLRFFKVTIKAMRNMARPRRAGNRKLEIGWPQKNTKERKGERESRQRKTPAVVPALLFCVLSRSFAADKQRQTPWQIHCLNTALKP